jgi:hypothetical protein
VAAVCGCANHGRGSAVATQRSQIERYLHEVEPIRLAVNKLLDGADPILHALATGRIQRGEAVRRMGGLERRFATYTVDIAALDPPSAQLRALNAPYAETYVLEDAYLSALTAGLADGNLHDLPNTQDAQRAAIIRWRTRLTVLASYAQAPLPADLQQAGRGEIAPSPDGSAQGGVSSHPHRHQPDRQQHEPPGAGHQRRLHRRRDRARVQRDRPPAREPLLALQR